MLTLLITAALHHLMPGFGVLHPHNAAQHTLTHLVVCEALVEGHKLLERVLPRLPSRI
jgi:hypothetical protein